jgi:hypothetical protein
MSKLFELLVLRPNRWYDRLPEPRRFLTFIITMAVLLIGCSLVFGSNFGSLAFCALFGIPTIFWRIIYFNKN